MIDRMTVFWKVSTPLEDASGGHTGGRFQRDQRTLWKGFSGLS